MIDGKWLLEGGQITASGLVNWFRDNFHIDGVMGNPYELLMQAAEEIPPGAEALRFLISFRGTGRRTRMKTPKA